VTRTIAVTGAALLAACSQAPQQPQAANVAAESTAATPAPAETAAVEATPIPAATPSSPGPTPTLTRDVGEPAVPEPGAPIPTTSLPEGPFAPDSGQAGADVVQTYVALLEQGKVRQALKLWDKGAAAPSAASFNRYREFHANVGGPGRIEGAAGSRYVTVPVQFSGTLRSGRPFVEKGTVTLRRVGEVDGATPAQKRWHIYSVDVKPSAAPVRGQRQPPADRGGA